MYHGDASRKKTLIDYGFRLPCAKDNRPLKSNEFFDKVGQKIYISATPAEFELNTSQQLVEQIIRPTGLLDPRVEVRETEGQIDDILEEIQKGNSQLENIREYIENIRLYACDELEENLQADIDYLTSDEAIADALIANECYFNGETLEIEN